MFEAKSSRALFCGGRECSRSRARERKRTERGTVVELPQRESAGQNVVGGVSQATLAALGDADRVGTPAGQAALVLAQRIDQSQNDPSAGVSALVKQYHATLGEALKGVRKADDFVDELRERRRRRLGA